jgi:hypothetical protein
VRFKGASDDTSSSACVSPSVEHTESRDASLSVSSPGQPFLSRMSLAACLASLALSARFFRRSAWWSYFTCCRYRIFCWGLLLLASFTFSRSARSASAIASSRCICMASRSNS